MNRELHHRQIPSGEPHPRVAVFDISASTIGLTAKIEKPADLEEFLDKPRSPGQSRLFVVEDLTPALIEILGQKLDVDPTVFLTHIWTANWYSKRSAPSMVSQSQSVKALQSFVRFRYVVSRPLRVEKFNPNIVERHACWNSSILRQISVKNLSSTGNPIGFARRQITMWVKPDEQDDWTGLKTSIYC